jgi:hypothetical protein
MLFGVLHLRKSGIRRCKIWSREASQKKQKTGFKNIRRNHLELSIDAVQWKKSSKQNETTKTTEVKNVAKNKSKLAADNQINAMQENLESFYDLTDYMKPE